MVCYFNNDYDNTDNDLCLIMPRREKKKNVWLKKEKRNYITKYIFNTKLKKIQAILHMEMFIYI